MSAAQGKPTASLPPEIARLLAEHRPGYGLPRRFYHDEAVFSHDIARIFHRHWLCAGHVSQAAKPGDWFLVRVDAEQVIVARDQSGALHASLNVCRHRGAEVCQQPHGHSRYFVCPYHAWAYNLDGTLAAARQMPPEFDRAAHGLRRVALKVAAGLVFVSFAERPLSFEHVARALQASVGRYGWDTARVAHRATYAVAANWKLAIENYVECYHCSPSHPEYSRLHALEQFGPRLARLNAALLSRTAAMGIDVGTLAAWNNDHDAEPVDCFRYALYDGVETGSETGLAVAPLMGAFTAYDGGVTSVHIGPASFLLAYPDHGVIYRFWPRGMGQCEMELIWLVRGDSEPERDYDVDRLTWLWRITTEADKRIVENAATGVASAFYAPGPLSPMEVNEARYLSWYLHELAAPA